jgi:hypothetical protein
MFVGNRFPKRNACFSTKSKSLELIQSSENYFCIVRSAVACLMKSDVLVICDDDVMPEADFLQESI